MPRNLSETLISSANAVETDEVYILLLTISHPNLSDDIRVTDDGLMDLPLAGVPGVVSRGQEFIKLPFEFALPGDPENGTPFTKIKIDNIDRDIVAAVRAIRGKADVKAEVILASDPDNVEISLEGFQLVGVTYDRFVVEGSLTIEQFENEPYPGEYYLPSTTPGAF